MFFDDQATFDKLLNNTPGVELPANVSVIDYLVDSVNDTELNQLYESAVSLDDFPEQNLTTWNNIKQYRRIFVQLAKGSDGKKVATVWRPGRYLFSL